jgi:hypothetical protein
MVVVVATHLEPLIRVLVVVVQLILQVQQTLVAVAAVVGCQTTLRVVLVALE